MRERHKRYVLDDDVHLAHYAINRRDYDLFNIVKNNLKSYIELSRHNVIVAAQGKKSQMRSYT
jgi:hypothetical protein